MKIKTKELTYDQVQKKKKYLHLPPKRQSFFMRSLLKVASKKDLKEVGFTYNIKDKLPKGGALVLMNHSSFVDLEIASTVMYPHKFHIVATSDGFVGKPKLLRAIGCIPTNKFVSDKKLVKDIKLALLAQSYVLMYPEASYSFDGTATTVPDSVSKMVKLLKCPVIMIRTHGAFLRDPLYNMLNKRDVKVSADIYNLITKEQSETLSVEALNDLIQEAFTFDNFKEQLDNKIEVNEDFRALGLERILYKCPDCLEEDKLKGFGIELTCNNCGKTYVLNKYGQLEGKGFTPRFTHIPDWYKWEREEVKKELINKTYKLDSFCKIGVLRDLKSIYMIGEGRLVHDVNGFKLTSNDGLLNYNQSPLASYGLYADYYWYELSDIICIGNNDELYYCMFDNVSVAKARLAQEELYKLCKNAL